MAFAEALQRRLWQRASSYFAGQGLEEAPPDLFVLRRQMRTAKRRGNHRWLGALRAVTCGASWTRGRLRDEGMHVDSALCPRCGQEVETLQHRCYGCPRNQDIPCCSRMASQLVRRANVELDNGRNSSLWLRGLTPSSWTEVPPPPEQVEVEWAIKDVDATCSFEGTIFAGGDGSGGRHGKDSRLRRAGWGAVILRAQRGIAPSALAEATFAAIGSAPVAGPHQSVNLAELLAFRHVLECTQHLSSLRLLYVLDSKYVSRGMAKLWRGRWPRTCVHEWKKVRDLIQGREVVLERISSHETAQSALELGASPVAFFLNSVADVVAGQAAARAQLSDASLASVEWGDCIAAAIRNRLAATFLASVDADPRLAKPPPKPPRQRIPLSEMLVSSQHSMSRCGRRYECSRCGTSVAHGSIRKFLRSECVPLCARADGRQLVPWKARVVVGHRSIDASHATLFDQSLQIFFCSACGATGSEHVRLLARPCRGFVSRAGKQALARIQKGLLPSSSSRALAQLQGSSQSVGRLVESQASRDLPREVSCPPPAAPAPATRLQALTARVRARARGVPTLG